MTNSYASEPWRGLPPEVADLLEPVFAAVGDEIIETIRREVPEYARPLEGSFGRGVRRGVGEALRQFTTLIRDPEPDRGGFRTVYVELGRGERLQGRTLDSLQAAYRVGARVAWRRAAETVRDRIDPEALSLLAESIFAYIDEISSDSVEGYSEARAEEEGTRRRRQRELIALLVRDPPPAEAEVRPLALAADWPLPRTVAAIAAAEEDLPGSGLPPDALTGSHEGLGIVVVPDPGGPGRPASLRAAFGEVPAVIGPTTDPGGLRDSWAVAVAGLRAAPSPGLVRAEDRLVEILCAEAAPLLARIAATRLEPLEALTPKARERMRATLDAYLRHGGNAVAAADHLGVHPQTARYRIARLRELFGPALDDPDRRFELELALRA